MALALIPPLIQITIHQEDFATLKGAREFLDEFGLEIVVFIAAAYGMTAFGWIVAGFFDD